MRAALTFRQTRDKMKYKINFSGIAYVEADNESEAVENFNVDEFYREEEIELIEEVEEFDMFM